MENFNEDFDYTKMMARKYMANVNIYPYVPSNFYFFSPKAYSKIKQICKLNEED